MKGASVAAPVLAANDETIEIEVAKALAWHFWIPKDRVKATVKDGHVTLRGNVEWLFQKRGCEDAIRNVAGVCSVANEIVVEMKEPARYFPRENSHGHWQHHKTGR